MSVTIKDVAIAAGVSVATVSRVVNRVNSVDAQIRSRVEEKIVELGYKPNQIARSLKNDVTNTVGVVVSNIANPFFVNVTLQIEKIVRKNNYTMLIVSTDSDQKKEIESIQLLESKRLDGIIISPNTNEIADYIKHIKCPIVAIDRKVLRNICDSVYVDKEESTFELVKYLYDHGHRSIAMLTGPKELSSNYDRFNGYIKAHYELGMEIDNENILFGEFESSFGKLAFSKLISRNKKPTAIISGSALITTGILIAAKNLSVNIPDDISLVSFGSLEIDELLDLKVTYIESLQTEIGQIAGEMIMKRIKEPGRPIDLTILHAKIIPGNSVKKYK